MAYTAVPTQNTGDLWTAAEHNTYIRDNFAAGVPDIFTAKGDLAVASAADVAGALAVGTNGQILTADSGESLGVKWASLAGGAESHARYKVSSTKSISNTTYTIIDYDTSVYDSDTAVTTGASWKYTVPSGKGGYFVVTASAYLQSSAGWAADEFVQLALYKNGTLDTVLGEVRIHASGTFSVFVTGASLVSLAAADYIDVRMYHNNGSSQTIDSDGDLSHIAIAKLY